MNIAEGLNIIAENEQKVYDTGYEKGKSEGGGGGDSYYDTFWDDYQQNGARNNYDYAFAGNGWTTKNLKPKYNMSFISAGRMFASSTIVDLKSHFESLGITIDFSRATTAQYLYDWAYTQVSPDIDVSNMSRLSNILRNAAQLITVKIKGIKETAIFDSTFINCNSLVNLALEGTIGQTGFSVQWSKNLSKASIENIINVLSATTTGLTATLSLDAVNKAFETSEGVNDGSTSDEWKTLIATKNNWTISLV